MKSDIAMMYGNCIMTVLDIVWSRIVFGIKE